MTTETPIPTLEKATEAGSGGQGLSETVKRVLENYFRDLDGHEPAHLYQLVLQEIERPLLESVMQYTRGNQSKASIVLGLNRGTLRKKLKQYDLN
jgi:Fis family transcriptional regulator